MLLHHARLPARLITEAVTIPLDEQDRGLWHKHEIAEGLNLIEQALKRKSVGAFQIQASISALHAEVASFEQTDWFQIVMLYDALLKLKQNPVVEINRIAALSFCKGPDFALGLLEQWQDRLDRYQPFHALKADVLRRLGSTDARTAYDEAIALTQNPQERAFLERRRQSLLH